MAEITNTQNNGVTANSSSMGIKGIVKVCILPNFTRYMLYSDGRVYNRETDTWLNGGNKKNKYLTVSLKDDNNNRVTKALHRFMYEAFIGEVPEGMQINHKDEVKTNNVTLFDAQGNITYTNLEVVTPRQNCNHGSRNERIRSTETGKKRIKQTFTVIVVNPFNPENSKTELHYNSLTEFLNAYPNENRLTWNYRLYTSKQPLAMYPVYTDNNQLLQIIPTSQHYKQRLERYNNNKKGVQQ